MDARTGLQLYFLYNLVFLGLQFIFVLVQSTSFLHAIPLPFNVYRELAYTAGTHIALYGLLSLLQGFLFWGLLQHYPKHRTTLWQHGIVWLVIIFSITAANAYYFPLSIFNRFLPSFPNPIWGFLALINAACMALLIMNALLQMIRYFPRMSASLLCVLVILTINPRFNPKDSAPRMSLSHPNIIIIGVDSLNPSSINSKQTPALAHFIEHSVQFTEALTPLARTYPAWTSILTGLHPYHHQARYNLIPSERVKKNQSLGWILQNKGYRTVFATDDRRFNGIEKDFGFKTIIGPKLGVNDILLGTFNDFPLSNLLINWPISRWLFPYNHLNRASHFSYYPSSFDRALQNALTVSFQTPPLFLAIHFTLPHWPYAWATSLPAQVKDEYSVMKRSQLYKAAIHRADKQVGDLIQHLDELGYLKNSLVILLSDHGEALYAPGSRQIKLDNYQGYSYVLKDYFHRYTSTALEMSAGHGSDLLSPTQYHCLLAFQIFNNSQPLLKPQLIDTSVSLMDIAPTVMSFLDFKPLRADGISLLPALMQRASLPERAFIMESGMLPNQFLTRQKARELGQQFFEVNQEGKLILKPRALKTLDQLKLFAIVKHGWVLALYPKDGEYIPVIQHFSDNKWSDDLNSPFTKISPALSLLKELEEFYQKKFKLLETPK